MPKGMVRFLVDGAVVVKWNKGQSGNPAGRPRGKSLAQQCRENSGRVMNRLLHWLEQDEHPAASLRAAEIILDRGYGKAVLPVADGTGHEALAFDLSDMSQEELQQAERLMLRLMARRVMPDNDSEPEPIPTVGW